MALGGVPVGMCITRFDPVCSNVTTGDPHFSCQVVSVEFNERVNETASIDISGGMPGRTCFRLDLPNEQLAPRVVVNTCTGMDPVLNNMTGRMKYTPIGDTMQGVLLQRLKESASCLCDCTEGDNCINRIAMTNYRMFFCYGQDAQPHPGGKYWVEHYPALGYQLEAQTSTASASADDGESFAFFAYSNPGFSGPNGVTLPIEAAEDNYEACWYGWSTNDCPPQDGGCSCANCGTATDALGVQVAP